MSIVSLTNPGHAAGDTKGTPPPDADGMPDGWERDRGLEPVDGARAGRDGYTNLELHLDDPAGTLPGEAR